MIGITSEIFTDKSTVCGCNSCNIKEPSKYYRNVLFTNASTPASQYFNQRRIQKVNSSFPSMFYSVKNVLNTQFIPYNGLKFQRSLSDRNQASIGKNNTPYKLLKTAWNSPGGIYAGGIGVDIKHDSYARRLNRLKSGLVVRDPYPVISGLKTKTGISTADYARCCNDNSVIPKDSQSMSIYSVYFRYFVGQNVYWKNPTTCLWELATVSKIIQYDTIQIVVSGQTITTTIWNVKPITSADTPPNPIPEPINVCDGCNVYNPMDYIINQLDTNGVKYY